MAKKRKRKVKRPPESSVKLGTSLILGLVSESSTREEDRIALNAIKDSAWNTILNERQVNTKVYWTASAILAAYNLGKEGLNLPIKEKSQ